MTVDRPEVLQPQVLEHALRRHEVLDALLHAVQRAVDDAADDGSPVERVLAPAEHRLVTAGGAQRREVVGETTGRRRIRTLVVVDDDDERQVLVDGDVVDRLPRHAAGQRPVADDRDGMPVAPAAEAPRLGDAVGPRQGRGRVRVLDDVVLGLGAARVPRQAALHPQPVEVVPAGEELVHVRLVTGVEDDGVLRRVEHTVQGDRQLDDAEVGPEVPAGLRYRGDEEVPDLLRQLVQLRGVERLDVVGAVNGVEQRHVGPPGMRVEPVHCS